jgi:hypothetical protein
MTHDAARHLFFLNQHLNRWPTHAHLSHLSLSPLAPGCGAVAHYGGPALATATSDSEQQRFELELAPLRQPPVGASSHTSQVAGIRISINQARLILSDSRQIIFYEVSGSQVYIVIVIL